VILLWLLAALEFAALQALAAPEELCVLAERPPRDPSQVELGDESDVFVVPSSYRAARRSLSRRRWPEGDIQVGHFVDHLPIPLKSARQQAVSLTLEVAPHPLDDALHIAQVLSAGPARPERQREPAHLTFLVDVSDSMRSVFTRSYPVLDPEDVDFDANQQLFGRVNRLTLAQRAVALLVDELDVRGTLAIATYGAGSEVVLEPTPLRQGAAIRAAVLGLGPPEEEGLDRGVKLAYRLASKAFDPCDDNRLIVIGDGGGVLRGDPGLAFRALSDRASSGIAVSAIGVGLRNRQSLDMERLASVGYGRAHYADSLYDAVLALRRELRPGGIALRDVALDVSFSEEAAVDVVPFTEERELSFSQLPEGWRSTRLYAFRLSQARGDVMTVSWSAGSQVPGEWTHYGAKTVHARQIHTRFDAASADYRVAVAAALFAEALQSGDRSNLRELFEIVADADRGYAADSELLALMALARQARDPKP